MKNNITININNLKNVTVPTNTKVITILKDNKDLFTNSIVGAKINNEIISFETILRKDTTINFFDTNDLAGYKMYISALKFVLEVALKENFDHNIDVYFDHSISHGIHASIINKTPFTKEDVILLKAKMAEIIQADLPFQKLNIVSEEASNYFNKIKCPEKSINIHNITNPLIVLYRLKNYYNYFYNEMPYSTSCLKKFDLIYINDNELALMFPTPRSKDSVPEYVHYQKIIDCFKSSKEWLNKLHIPYVSDINSLITSGQSKDLIRICETAYDNQIHNISQVVMSRNIRYLMVAGPSSSGKTTTTKKIALNLQAEGYETLLISVDDYFVDREKSPKNPDGTYNFECIEAIDVAALNVDLNNLLQGKKVVLPTFNFITGKREYLNDPVTLPSNGIVLMEGLHCLNDALTPNIKPELKYKVYLSPFIALNVDRHNYISTVDLRLIRRIIRDNTNRGYNVSKTIEAWQSVRRGEEQNIFPFIHQADVIVNTSLAYEVGILKVYAEPLLYSVKNDSPFYEEARRLINFLKNFFPIPSEYVDGDSVLREFIGNSNFK